VGSLAGITEVGVGLVQPVLPRRIEHIHIQGILQSDGLVRYTRREVKHLAFAHIHRSGIVTSNGKPERPLQYIRDLLVFMFVHGDDCARFQVDVGYHHAIPRDKPSIQFVAQFFEWDFFPTMMRRVCHFGSVVISFWLHTTSDIGDVITHCRNRLNRGHAGRSENGNS
jgi:hypothetical protein